MIRLNLRLTIFLAGCLTFVVCVTCYAWTEGPVPGMPPPWSKGVIWYQIFPDRFCNGDTNNDPPLVAQQDAWPHDTLRPWRLHPWTSDWYKMQSWEKEGGKGKLGAAEQSSEGRKHEKEFECNL